MMNDQEKQDVMDKIKEKFALCWNEAIDQATKVADDECDGCCSPEDPCRVAKVATNIRTLKVTVTLS